MADKTKFQGFISSLMSIDNEDRMVIALERIANALERMTPDPLAHIPPVPPTGTLVAATDEEIWEQEQKNNKNDPMNPPHPATEAADAASE